MMNHQSFYESGGVNVLIYKTLREVHLDLRDFLGCEPLRLDLREAVFDAFLERRRLPAPVILRERRRERLDLREALREVRFDLRDFLDLREPLRERLDF